MKPKGNQDYLEWLAEDCTYYDQAMCRKGLPGITGCNRIGCAAYYPKNGGKE